MTRHRMYINGQRVESHRGAWFPVYDPSTEEIIAEVPDADAADIDRAVQAAVAAFESGPWPQTTSQDRGRLLFKLGDRSPGSERQTGRSLFDSASSKSRWS